MAIKGQAQTPDSSCIFAANGPATVYIEYRYVTSEGEGLETGSGFIISPAGHVITAAHVVSPRIKDVSVQSSKVSVRVGGRLNPAVEATVPVRDSSVDLALLQLPTRPGTNTWPTVDIGNQVTLPIGAGLIGLGFGSTGDLAVVPAGEKTANNTIIDGQLKPWWQTNLALNPGNSGGPIFGQLGTVVGVAVAKNDGAQLVTYIIPISRAQHLIDAAAVASAQAGGRCAVFPECRHASHEIQGYTVDDFKSKWGDWRSGGYNRGAFCNDFLAELQLTYPASTFTFVRDDEQSRDTQPPFRVIEYRYFCEFQRRENPIYELKRSIACLQ
ncbi:serine protease [Methylobacter sp.]|uniref:S1C family serine protease n=1 Tax=Methylobacter sp. TaxID=2051955 RepID=UPI0025D3B644|nr:serine protease [Methylobacter sp.]